MSLKLVTVEKVLMFLQDEYEKFRAKTQEQQDAERESNQLIRKSLREPNLTLRDLYIDLAMHDQMILHSKEVKDKNEKRIRLLIENKLMIESLIKERQAADESVLPDVEVERVAQDGDLRQQAFNIWITNPDMRKKLEKAWTDDIDSERLINLLVQKFIVLELKRVEDFRALVNTIECVIRKDTMNSQ